MIRFTIIIPMYQAFSTIKACLAGVASQVFHNFEVIAIDSSPGLESVDWIQTNYLYRVIRLPEKTRSEKARNLAVQSAQGEILVFLDADCVPEPSWLSALDKTFNQHAVAVCGPVACYNTDLLSITAHIAKFWLWLPHRKIKRINHAPTANMAILKNAYVQFGGLDERHLASADTGLGYTLQDTGQMIIFADNARVSHIHQTTWQALLQERYARGYEFGVMRSYLRRWSRFLSLLYVMFFPFWTIKSVICKFQVCLSCGYGFKYLIALPLHFIVEWCWVLGQTKAHWQAIFQYPVTPKR